MIRLEDILTPGRSLVNVPGSSKKKVLEKIAELIGQQVPDQDQQDVYEALLAREKLGSTGFGNGIAIPHCRLKGCTAPISALLHLEHPIDFDANEFYQRGNASAVQGSGTTQAVSIDRKDVVGGSVGFFALPGARHALSAAVEGALR